MLLRHRDVIRMHDAPAAALTEINACLMWARCSCHQMVAGDKRHQITITLVPI